MEFTRQVMKNPKWKIGEHSYGKIAIIGEHLLDEFQIGKFCSIGQGVSLMVKGYHHNPEAITTYPLGAAVVPGWPNVDVPRQHQYFKMGNDVWVGQGAMFYNNITIGDGAIIGTRALVTKDVPPYTIVGGVPAKIIRQRFSDEDVAKLLEAQWWNWPKEKISRHVKTLYGGNVNAIVNAK